MQKTNLRVDPPCSMIKLRSLDSVKIETGATRVGDWRSLVEQLGPALTSLQFSCGVINLQLAQAQYFTFLSDPIG